MVGAKAGDPQRESREVKYPRATVLGYIIVMPTTDKRVDAYIDRAQDFAKPILKHLRKLVHDACPDVR